MVEIMIKTIFQMLQDGTSIFCIIFAVFLHDFLLIHLESLQEEKAEV
jgi:hypothetical protein